MSRITDEQRRAAAAKLRGLHPRDKSWWGISGFDWEWFADELFEAIGYDTSGHNEWTDRLADLIDPPLQCPYYRSDRHYCSIHDVPAIDRDALLAQVKELERCAWYFGLDFDADEPLRDRLKDASEDFAECARRIREALGGDRWLR